MKKGTIIAVVIQILVSGLFILSGCGSGADTKSSADSAPANADASPPNSFADIAGTWTIKSGNGKTDTFTIVSNGTVTGLSVTAEISGPYYHWQTGHGTEHNTRSHDFGPITVDSKFTFAQTDAKPYRTIYPKDSFSITGEFKSKSTLTIHYTVEYSYNLTASTGAYYGDLSGFGTWTATKVTTP